MCRDKRTLRIWAWGALFVVSVVATIGLSTFLAVNIMGDKLKDSQCTALELLTNPKTHLQNSQFRDALIIWERGDGCQVQQ